MIAGMPGGRQLAVRLSSAFAAWRTWAWALAAYSGVREGLAAAPDTPRAPGRAAGAAPGAPRPVPPPPPPKAVSQTPLKSGSLAKAAHSAGVGAWRVTFWAHAAGPQVSEAAKSPKRILPMCPI